MTRILMGPLDRNHPEARCILSTLTDCDILTFSTTGETDVRFDLAADSFSDILTRLPRGWQPDLVFFLSPEYNAMPRDIDSCPYPLIATIGDWNLGYSAIRDVVGCFDVLITDRKGVEIFRALVHPCVEHGMLFGHVPDVHFRMEGIEQDIDISLVGNLNHEVQRERSR